MSILQRVLIKIDAHPVVEKAYAMALVALPECVKDRVCLHRMGELTCEPSLRDREVPTITVQEFVEAMRDRCGRNHS